MSVNPLLLPIKKDSDTIKQTVLTNIIKMLTYRKWLKNKNIDKLSSMNSDDSLYKIKTDIDINGEPNNNVIYIKLLPQKVTGINKSPIIVDFLKTYKKEHKILVVDSISDKAYQQLVSMPNIEIFNENALMINLVEHVSSPQYEVLTNDETNEFLESYHVTKNKLPILFSNDPAALYLNLKKGQIVRIIRNSEMTASSIAYRIVVNKVNVKI
jgi:DNA-directed RNA polymerase subunit H (RpoH/RPB5)